MTMTCISADGFEDQLTGGAEYRALEIKGGSVLLRNDAGAERWYGLSKFQLLAG